MIQTLEVRKELPVVRYRFFQEELRSGSSEIDPLVAISEYLIEKGVLTPPENGIGAEGCWMSVEK